MYIWPQKMSQTDIWLFTNYSGSFSAQPNTSAERVWVLEVWWLSAGADALMLLTAIGWRGMTWQNITLLNPTSVRAASPKKQCPPQGWLPPVVLLPVVQWALVYSFGGGHQGGVLVPQGCDRTEKQTGLLFLYSTWLGGLFYLPLPPFLKL